MVSRSMAWRMASRTRLSCMTGFSWPSTPLYYYSDQNSIDFMDTIAYYLREVGMKVETVQSQQGTVDLFQTRNYDVGYKGLSAFNIAEWYGEYSSGNANFRRGRDQPMISQLARSISYRYQGLPKVTPSGSFTQLVLMKTLLPMLLQLDKGPAGRQLRLQHTPA